MYYLIAFYQRIVELLCHAKNFPNDPRISQIRSTANVLRNELMDHRNWTFNEDFEDLKKTLILQFFLILTCLDVMCIKFRKCTRRSEQYSDRFMSVPYSQQSHSTQVKHRPKKHNI